MRKKIFVMVIVFSLLALSACGKKSAVGTTEEGKAAAEIYNHLSAEEQANVEKDRQEMADYEAKKEAEAIEKEEAANIDWMKELTEWKIGVDMDFERELDFGHDVYIFFPKKELVTKGDYSDTYAAGLLSSGHSAFSAKCYMLDYSWGGKFYEKDYQKSEEIGRYKVLLLEDGTIHYRLTIFDSETAYELSIDFWKGISDIEELAKKNYEYVIEQVKAWPQDAPVAKTEVEAEIPYGEYSCDEIGVTYCDINILDGEFDVINIFKGNDELLADFVWDVGDSYYIKQHNGEILGLVTMKENGDMEIMSIDESIVPYEGYYKLKERWTDLHK